MTGLEQFYTVKQVADSWGVDEATVRRYCMSGQLRSVRPRHMARRLIPESAVTEFLHGGVGGRLAGVVEMRPG